MSSIAKSAIPKLDIKRLAYAIGWLIAFRAAGNVALTLLAAALGHGRAAQEAAQITHAIGQELGNMMTLASLLAFWMCHQRGVLPGLQEDENAAGMAAWIAETTRYRAMLTKLEEPIEQVVFGKAGDLPPEGRPIPELSFTRQGRPATTEQRAAERIRSLRRPH